MNHSPSFQYRLSVQIVLLGSAVHLVPGKVAVDAAPLGVSTAVTGLPFSSPVCPLHSLLPKAVISWLFFGCLIFHVGMVHPTQGLGVFKLGSKNKRNHLKGY